jgi:hypothetical protein
MNAVECHFSRVVRCRREVIFLKCLLGSHSRPWESGVGPATEKVSRASIS